jgi:hypothetical protein
VSALKHEKQKSKMDTEILVELRNQMKSIPEEDGQEMRQV